MELKQYYEYLKRGKVPPNAFHIKSKHSVYRNTIIERSSWFLLNQKTVDLVIEKINNRTCLEIMGGLGWLAHALSLANVDIVSTDDFSWEKSQPSYIQKCRFDVERLEASKAVDKYSDKEVLLCTWPPYNENAFTKAIKNWSKDIIYIGEDRDGCTADDEFFEIFEVEEQLTIPTWPWIHDSLMIGKIKQ